MAPNLIDLLIHIMQHLRSGERMQELKREEFSKYTDVELGAAYAWLYQRYPELQRSGRLANDPASGISLRILHLAEYMMLPRESHGFLLKLLYSGVITPDQMEKVIEKVMMTQQERCKLDKLRQIVSDVLDEDPSVSFGPGGKPLTGSEKIN